MIDWCSRQVSFWNYKVWRRISYWLLLLFLQIWNVYTKLFSFLENIFLARVNNVFWKGRLLFRNSTFVFRYFILWSLRINFRRFINCWNILLARNNIWRYFTSILVWANRRRKLYFWRGTKIIINFIFFWGFFKSKSWRVIWLFFNDIRVIIFAWCRWISLFLIKWVIKSLFLYFVLFYFLWLISIRWYLRAWRAHFIFRRWWMNINKHFLGCLALQLFELLSSFHPVCRCFINTSQLSCPWSSSVILEQKHIRNNWASLLKIHLFFSLSCWRTRFICFFKKWIGIWSYSKSFLCCYKLSWVSLVFFIFIPSYTSSFALNFIVPNRLLFGYSWFIWQLGNIWNSSCV